jgi:hypothetical protein
MPLWGNKDTSNSKPLFAEQRQVVGLPLAQFLVTANSTTAGNTIVVTAAANTINTLGLIGSFVYAFDANTNVTGALSKFQDTSIINQNEVAFFKSNNTVVSIDTANSIIRTANNVNFTLNAASRVYFANAIVFNSNVANTRFADTILVTATRAANANNTSANVGNMSAGWVYVQKKTNGDGTVRYLKETLVALANATASNTSSGNTSFGQIVSGV